MGERREYGFPQGRSAAASVFSRLGNRVSLPSIPPKTVKGRACLFYEGDVCDYVYEILSGAVRLVKRSADGRRFILDFKYTGDVVGLCMSRRHFCSAEMINGGAIRAIPSNIVTPDFCFASNGRQTAASILYCDLCDAQKHLILTSMKNPRERVAAFLVDMANKGEPVSTKPRKANIRPIHLPMPRRDIADYLGLTPETVCRTFAYYRKLGIIAVRSASDIDILSWNRLIARCGDI